MPPGVVDRLEVIDIDEQYRRLSMASTAGLKFVTQQRFPVTAIEYAGHSVAGTHQLKPTLMLCQTDRRAVAEPGKQYGVDHQHGERQPQRQRFRGQYHRTTRGLHGEQSRQSKQRQSCQK